MFIGSVTSVQNSSCPPVGQLGRSVGPSLFSKEAEKLHTFVSLLICQKWTKPLKTCIIFSINADVMAAFGILTPLISSSKMEWCFRVTYALKKIRNNLVYSNLIDTSCFVQFKNMCRNMRVLKEHIYMYSKKNPLPAGIGRKTNSHTGGCCKNFCAFLSIYTVQVNFTKILQYVNNTSNWLTME